MLQIHLESLGHFEAFDTSFDEFGQLYQIESLYINGLYPNAQTPYLSCPSYMFFISFRIHDGLLAGCSGGRIQPFAQLI